MAQIFHRSTNSLSRATIFGAVFVVAALFWAAAQVQRSPYVTYAGVVRPQPAPFSHQHHVAGLGIDCRYCHTSVENSRFAGIPPTKTCMNCHAQIWTKAPMLEPVRESFRTDKSLVWTRVNDLPDFVYFDHSIHINKGVGCNTCHGPVDRMPLMYNYASLQMEWCLNCHRAPEKNLRPRDQVFNMRYQAPTADSPVIVDGKSFVDQDSLGLYLVKAYKLRSERDITSCNTCHR
ncbi:MAG TPA: cytochrome c3 family protein [Terriglobales bacterium]|jgi:Cytochrome c7 and related cytochrome c|nr:cytochrome c3 family protein [Terriglobales bacterium]